MFASRSKLTLIFYVGVSIGITALSSVTLILLFPVISGFFETSFRWMNELSDKNVNSGLAVVLIVFRIAVIAIVVTGLVSLIGLAGWAFIRFVRPVMHGTTAMVLEAKEREETPERVEPVFAEPEPVFADNVFPFKPRPGDKNDKSLPQTTQSSA